MMKPATGQLVDHTIRSRALVKPMRLRLYLPPRYGDLAIRYPVIYLLHPWGMDECYFTEHLRLHDLANRLIQAGTLPPFVAVMPQGDKSYFLNAEDPGGDFSMMVRLDPGFFEGALDGYGDYGDYLLQDVIGFVERGFEVRSDRTGRVIAGISMGAAGAAVQAFTHPDLFGAVGIHSPALFDETRLGPPWIFGLGDPAAFAARDPVQLAAQLLMRSSLSVYLDCGQQDEFDEPTAELHRALVDRDVQHTYISRPGHHSIDYWLAHLAEYLGFYAAGW